MHSISQTPVGRCAVHSYRGVRAQVCLLVWLRVFGEPPLLAADAAAAELEGVALVSLPVGEDLYDGKLDWCGDELDFLTSSHLSVMLGLPICSALHGI